MTRHIFYRLVAIAVLLILLTPTTSLSAPNQRTALVIGNGAYKSSPLRNPVNDATDIANALRKFGFSVILKTNANQRTMEESIRYFGKKLRSGGVGLFYFAGHGLQVKGRNYLIPIDTVIETESDVRYEAVDAGRVLGKMEDAGNDLNIVILDACRDNPFTRSFRSGDRGLAKMDAPKGSLVAYATAPGSVAADGEGRNGIYTKYLLKYISNPNLKVEEVLKQVRIGVINETNEKQIPWESSSLTGEFYFASKRGIAVAKYKPQKVEPTVLSEKPDSMEPEYVETKEIRYAKSLIKRGKESKAKDIIDDIIENSKDETTIIEATYYKILWGLASDEIDEFDKFKAYYPNFRYLYKLEIAVNKREKERERKRLAIYGKKIDSDGTLIAYATGVVYDKKTGLEWVAGPVEITTWYEAKRWVKNLNVAGDGWRMPTIAELKTLYKKGAGSRNMTPLLKTTGWYVWSGEKKGLSSAWRFYFDKGHEGWRSREDYSYYGRGFAVRSRR